MKICVLIPAYNCAHIIAEVITRIALPGPADEIIVVDDCSKDDTLTVASRFPRVYAVRNPTNLGYGGTSHRLYQLAIERQADYTVTIHGDLGHRPEDVPLVLEPVCRGEHDIVLGSRLLYLINAGRQSGWLTLLSSEVRQGMPLNRALGHFGLTWFQNKCFGTELHSFHDGMRACTRPVMEWIIRSQFSTWYHYDTDLILHAHLHGFRIGEVAVKPFYDGRPNSAAPSVRYGLRVVRYTLAASRNAKRTPRSARTPNSHPEIETPKCCSRTDSL
jgi:glycosyltransferase involved in cell wall biosynthesis